MYVCTYVCTRVHSHIHICIYIHTLYICTHLTLCVRYGALSREQASDDSNIYDFVDVHSYAGIAPSSMY